LRFERDQEGGLFGGEHQRVDGRGLPITNSKLAWRREVPPGSETSQRPCSNLIRWCYFFRGLSDGSKRAGSHRDPRPKKSRGMSVSTWVPVRGAISSVRSPYPSRKRFLQTQLCGSIVEGYRLVAGSNPAACTLRGRSSVGRAILPLTTEKSPLTSPYPPTFRRSPRRVVARGLS